MIDEREIIKQCLNGNHEAFAILVDRYKSFVYSLAYCSFDNIETCEDIAQEVFISVWKGLTSLRDHDKFQAWLVSITRNIINHYIRKKYSSPRTCRIDKEESLISENIEEPLDVVLREEERVILWQALESMPVEYKETFILYYQCEKSTKQVAMFLNVSPEVVRQRLVRGRKMLHDQVEGMFEKMVKDIQPDKKFTASVIAAISSIPVGVAVSEAAVVSASASAPFVAALKTIMATTAAKVATVTIIAVAAIATGLILNNNEKSQPTQKTETIQPITATDSSPVETHFNASENLPQPIVTPTPQQPQQAPVEQPNSEIYQPTKAATATTTETTDTFTPRGVLSGLITDKETGEPVIDAQVSLTLPNNHIEQTHADEDGFYFFDKLPQYGNCELGIESKEYVGLTYSYNNRLKLDIESESQNILHIKLEKACMFEVIVKDEKGMPIEGVQATVTNPESGFRQCLNFGYNPTDKSGKTIEGGIKPSMSVLMITLMHNNLYAPAYKEIILNDPETLEIIDVTMKQGIDISGQLLYADGLPADTLKISATPQWWHSCYCCPSIEISDKGLFTFKHIIPGTYNISVLFPTEKEGRFSNEKIATISIKEGEFLDLKLPYKNPLDSEKFTGRIIIDGNCDVDMIHISGYNHTDSFSKSVDIENNKREIPFEIDRVASGIYTLQLSSDNLRHERIEDVSIPTGNFECIMECRDNIDISGSIITEEAGVPVENFRVLPSYLDPYREKTYNLESKWINYHQADNGKFTFNAKEHGTYAFTIDSEDYAPQTIEINTEDTTSFTAKLTTGKTLTGSIIDTTGKPVNNAKIIPLTKNSGYSQREKVFVSDDYAAITDENGNFILTKLPADSETIKIQHPDYPEKVIEPQLLQKTTDITITLDSGCSVEGYVYDNNGNPRTNSSLYIQDIFDKLANKDTSNLRAVTDENGYYKFDNLPEKFCFIKHSKPGRTEETTVIGVLPCNSKMTRVDLGGKTLLTGRLLLNGSPLSGTSIAIATRSSFSYSTFLNNSKIQDDGTFTFSGIPSGVKKFFYKPDEQTNKWRQIVEFDTKDASLDLGDISVDGCSITVSINSPDNFNFSACSSTEDFVYPTIGEIYMEAMGENQFRITNLLNGQYVIRACRKSDFAVFMSEIEVSPDKSSKYNIELPKANSSIYGKLPYDPQTLVCKREDMVFIGNIRGKSDGSYSIKNMPAGKYCIINALNNTAVKSFELKDKEELRCDLDDFSFENSGAMAILFAVDSENRLTVNNYDSWLEANGFRYDTLVDGLLTASPGEYKLHITCPGYKDYSRTVTLTPCDMTNTQSVSTITAILERE